MFLIPFVFGHFAVMSGAVRSDEDAAWWWSKKPQVIVAGPGGQPSCPCVPVTVGLGAASIGGSTIMFAESVGRKCHAWDNDVFPGACEDDDQIPGRGKGWCARKWCYVDPCKCDLKTMPMQSMYFPNATYNGKKLYFSYSTCQSKVVEGQACMSHKTEKECTEVRPCDWTGDHCVPMELAPLCTVFTKRVVPKIPKATNQTSTNVTETASQ